MLCVCAFDPGGILVGRAIIYTIARKREQSNGDAELWEASHYYHRIQQILCKTWTGPFMYGQNHLTMAFFGTYMRNSAIYSPPHSAGFRYAHDLSFYMNSVTAIFFSINFFSHLLCPYFRIYWGRFFSAAYIGESMVVVFFLLSFHAIIKCLGHSPHYTIPSLQTDIPYQRRQKRGKTKSQTNNS